MARRKRPTRELPADSHESKLTEIIEGRGKQGDTRWVSLMPESSPPAVDASMPDTVDLLFDVDEPNAPPVRDRDRSGLAGRPRPASPERRGRQGTTELLDPGQTRLVARGTPSPRASARTKVLGSTPTELRALLPEAEPPPSPERECIPAKPRRSGIKGFVMSNTELIQLSPLANGLVVLLLLTTLLGALGWVLLGR